MHEVNKICYDSKEEAMNVLNNAKSIISCYGYVTVKDILDLASFISEPCDRTYGWNNLENAKIVQTRDYFNIKFPAPTQLTELTIYR